MEQRNIAIPPEDLDVLLQLEDYGLRELPSIAGGRVLDLGAHVGLFTIAALHRWPDTHAIAYEPHPETFELLRGNVTGMPVRCMNVAAGDVQATARLFEGARSRTDCSLERLAYPHGCPQRDEGPLVQVIDAASLPPADALKIDTEGAELGILRRYRHLSKLSLLLVEAHAVRGDLAGQKAAVAQIASNAGMVDLGARGDVLRFACASAARGGVAFRRQ